MLLCIALATTVFIAITEDRAVALGDAIGIITALLLVVIVLRRRLLGAPPRGMLVKKFELRPSTLSSLVETVTVDMGEALDPEECVDRRKDLNQGRDCYRAYSLRGRGTGIRISREFSWAREMTVSSVLRMGPVGEGEDDMVGAMRTAIDDAKPPSDRSLEVDFSNLRPEYARRKRFFFACAVLMFPTVLAFGIVNLMVMEVGDPPSMRGLLLWSLTGACAGFVLLMYYWAMVRLYDLAREVDIG